MKIRKFNPDDAVRLSQLIIQNLQQVNIRDYAINVIEALIPYYSPDRIIDKSDSQHMIVCVAQKYLIGTASLDYDRVRNVFVDFAYHKKGVGKLLMTEIEIYARKNDLTRLYLHSGLSAEGFYTNLGYFVVGRFCRDLDGIPIPEIKMEKDLEIVSS